MEQVDANSTRRKGFWATLAIATVASASAVAIALPATCSADPETPTPVPPSTTAAPSSEITRNGSETKVCASTTAVVLKAMLMPAASR
ncbi:hypothetical protein A5673_16695 [Mycobacterium sp. E3198]|nr:APA family fibronectin-binding glycoprotein [Mycobacterium sp. E3198]OBG37244.1 hypothetical protein A5673_16695 [Mycobacterium sp. E3198]